MKARITILTATVAVVACLAAAIAPAAHAELGWWQSEYVTPNTAICHDDVINVYAPAIKPISTGPGFVTGGSQWTAFEAILERWNATLGRWDDVYVSEPFFHQADWVAMDPEQFWYVNSSGNWVWRVTAQNLPMTGKHGYFRYALQVYWFDQRNNVSAQLRILGQGMGDDRGIDNRLSNYRDWCYYP